MSDSAEQELISSFVADLAEYAIVTFDVDGTVRSWNSGAQELFGYAAAEARGLALAALIVPSDDPRTQQDAWLQDVRVWGIRKEALRLRTHRDHTVTADVVLKALRNRENRIVGYGLMARATTVDRAERRRGEPAVVVGLSTVERRRILLVDDDDLARETIQAMLGVAGHEVLTAANGDEALDIFRSDAEFDLMLVDVVMPGSMNGVDLAGQARALTPDLKVLFISGYLPAALVDQGVLDQNADILVKPFRASDLARKMENLMGRA